MAFILSLHDCAQLEIRVSSVFHPWPCFFFALHLPQPAIRQATDTFARIAEVTEDKAMYDAREKVIRDRKWELDARERKARREGKIEGEIEGEMKVRIETTQMLQGLACVAVSEEQELRALGLEQFQALTRDLREKLRNRMPS